MKSSDLAPLRLALRLAQKARGKTSPNPMVGAVLVKGGEIIGRGWHRRAGLPHAEIEALRDAQRRGNSVKGATLLVTLEPCSTHGRTPPCTDAIIAAGIRRVVVGTTDPNPKHAGKGLRILSRAGVEAVLIETRTTGGKELATECARLNDAFNHWIVHRTPFVTVKSAMSLDGKIATATGESKWITGEKAREFGMQLRQSSDAILIGVNTLLADDPALTLRNRPQKIMPLRRIVLDSLARTPLTARVVSDEFAALTTIVVSDRAPRAKIKALAARVNVLVSPAKSSGKSRRRPSGKVAPQSGTDLRWLLKKLGSENVTSLLVEGGGEVNASFLFGGFAHRVAFFYAPKILCGRDARKSVAGEGIRRLEDAIQLRDVEWRRLGADWLLSARVKCDAAK